MTICVHCKQEIQQEQSVTTVFLAWRDAQGYRFCQDHENMQGVDIRSHEPMLSQDVL